MAVLIRSLIVAIILIADIKSEVVVSQNGYGMDSQIYNDFIIQDYENAYNSLSGSFNLSIFSGLCCCTNKIWNYAKNDVKYIVGGYLSKAIDNAVIANKALSRLNAIMPKIRNNLKRLVQLEANYNNNYKGTLLNETEISFYENNENEYMCKVLNEDFLEIDKNSFFYIYDKGVVNGVIYK